MTQQLQLKPKQHQVIEAVNDPIVDTLVLFGTVGTGKTDVAAHVVLSIADSMPKTYWPVFRQHLTTAKKTVIPSYLEMADKMNMIEGVDYRFNKQDYQLVFPNGSVIPFIEADITKDRDAKKVKGINASGNHLDEPDELDEIMFVAATSRKGRRNENGQPSLSILTLNPTDGHLKTKFYDRWKAGTLPPNVRCIEFDLADSWQTQQDIDQLLTNPSWWTERYLHNNWDYADESTSLFKSRSWAESLVDELNPAAIRSAGYDVARSGVDRSVRALLYDLTIADLTITKDKAEHVSLPKQAEWLLEDAGDNHYGIERTAIDAVGLGIGMVDDLARGGYHAREYMSGAKPDPDVRLDVSDNSSLNFDNLRSQMIYLYARGVELGLIKHFKGSPWLKELQQEAMQHKYDTSDKVFKVESKEKIKKRLGVSPDLFDSVLMALYVALKQVPTMEGFDVDDEDDDAITDGLLDETF